MEQQEALINLSNAIRQKYMQLKLNDSNLSVELEKKYRPIITPLKELVHQNKIKQLPNQNNILKHASPTSIYTHHTPLKQERPITEKPRKLLEDYPATSSTTADYNKPINYDDDDNEYFYHGEDETPRSIFAKFIATPENLNQTIEQFSIDYGDIASDYIINLLADAPGTDKAYGLKHDSKTDSFKMGKDIVEIKHNDLFINGNQYEGSRGLYELITRAEPDIRLYTEKDLENYKKILLSTNVINRAYDPKLQLRGNRGRKYKKIIAPLLKHSTDSSPTSGKGLFSVVSGKPYDYVYWDDPNELVDRLRLLYASSSAGNNSHQNEINSIIKELREAHIIC